MADEQVYRRLVCSDVCTLPNALQIATSGSVTLCKTVTKERAAIFFCVTISIATPMCMAVPLAH